VIFTGNYFGEALQLETLDQTKKNYWQLHSSWRVVGDIISIFQTSMFELPWWWSGRARRSCVNQELVAHWIISKTNLVEPRVSREWAESEPSTVVSPVVSPAVSQREWDFPARRAKFKCWKDVWITWKLEPGWLGSLQHTGLTPGLTTGLTTGWAESELRVSREWA